MIPKTNNLPRLLSLAVFFALAFSSSSCSKDIASTEVLPALTPANIDANAGSWKMIVLTGPTQVSVTAPGATGDPAYQSELATIKSGQANLTDAQKTAITYWSSGGVLRWNEIMRELVARSDLPPSPNPDGSYPVPNPANPFANPQYPFSNPPYAVRAYSNVAVAQYEALKVAWYYKFLYNRPSPSKVDSSIQSLMPTTNVPSYPSEDAVESAVNTVLLTLLFPTSVDEINAKAAEQQQAALLSGRASPSDIAAGVALGNAVAAIIAARAATDGMKAAGGTSAIWQALADGATARGEIPWISQDGPPRPPMLPLFGQVKAWMLTPTDIVNERATPPPSTSSAQMKTETAEVKSTVNNLSRDQLATVYKWADGVSTPTPPGHWDAIAAPYISAASYSEVRSARVYALLNMALHDAGVACWDTKYFYFNPRPSQLDPEIKTQTGLPNFPSYVSGHSDFSAAGADVLSYLFPSGATYFNAQAQEAAMSRLYGGIHYRSDITVGLAQGQRIGDYTIRFAKADGAN
ncbi:MAG TPA: phosphatase PAP2 family protein [Edaphobacter sp.]|nr:phosphatase PAP2 family protein [Edaphobacter sp.]